MSARRSLLLLSLVGCYSPALETSDGAPDGSLDGRVDGPRPDAPGLQVVDAGGELVEILGDWQVEVWHPFEEFTWVQSDFVDGSTTHDNEPVHLFTVGAPFPDGLIVVGGRQLWLILFLDKSVSEHAYRPADPNGTMYADDLRVGIFSPYPTPEGGPGIFLGGASELGGDGVWFVSDTWNATRELTNGNVAGLTLDPAGAFDGIGGQQVYFSDQNALHRFGAGQVVELDTDSIRVATDGSMLVVHDIAASDNEVFQVDSGTHTLRLFFQTERFIFADGVAPEPPDLAYGVRDEQMLVLVSAVGEPKPLARTLTPEWRWKAVTVPQAGVFYVVESNRALNDDRILRFTSP